MLGLIGPNGAGKTTLLEAIAGLLPADGGGVLWRGTSLAAVAAPRVRLLPAGRPPPVGRPICGREVIELFATVYGRSKASSRQTIRSLGPVAGSAQARPALSKGYSRRLMLALALLTPHPLLLMDEPFDGFDLRQTREIMGVLRDVAGRGARLFSPSTNWPTPSASATASCCSPTDACAAVGTLAELRAQYRDAVGRTGGRIPCAHLTPPRLADRAIYPLLAKELWEAVSGRALWTMLLILCPLVGYSFFQAVSLYGEASSAARDSPALASGLSPLDGVLVPDVRAPSTSR